MSPGFDDEAGFSALYDATRNAMRRGHQRRGRAANATKALTDELHSARGGSSLEDLGPIMTALAACRRSTRKSSR